MRRIPLVLLTLLGGACSRDGLQSQSLGNSALAYNTVASVTGTLRAAASMTAIPAAKVAIGAEHATTDSDGAFVLRGLAAGKQTLSAHADGYLDLALDVEVALGANDLGALDMVAVAQSVSCPRGFSDCSGECVDTQTEDKHCGACATGCTSEQVCEAGACVALPFDCSTSPCPVKSYCDPQTHACTAGCLAKTDCPSDKVCDVSSKSCACASDAHVCFGQCAANKDPQSCGNQCTPCLAPANADPTCDGKKCDYACRAPFLRCAGGCCLALANVQALSSSGWHMNCATVSGHDAYCWGNNDHGAIGDGTSINIRNVPTRVDALAGVVASVSAGYMFSCALTTGGAAKCWGQGQYGQLGDGAGMSSLDVVQVFGLASGVTQVSAGGLHACALVSGGVRCWGGDEYGELGNGASGTTFVKPVTVCTNKTTCGALAGITQISAGSSVTCAVSTTGALYCWGSNLYGRLGNGIAASDTDVATLVQGQAGIKRVAVGASHSCAITATNGVRCWGFGGHGQIGDGFKMTRYVPTDVSGLAGDVLDVSVGDSHSCALLVGGAIQCWGENNKGQLGDGTIDERSAPVNVVGLGRPAIAMSAGEEHTCALLDDQTLQCWGNNEYGELGDSTNNNTRAIPGYVLKE